MQRDCAAMGAWPKTTPIPSCCARSPSSWPPRRRRSCAPARARSSVESARRRRHWRCVPRAPRPIPSPSSTPRPSGCCATGWPTCGPANRVLGEEEGGPPGGRDGQLTWVLDPIDGTVNFVYGIEAYAVSVAVQRDGASVAGAVANVPAGALYSAAVGHGARLHRGRRHHAAAVQCCHRSVDVVGGHRLLLRRRPTGSARPRSSPRCCPPCATCGGSARAHSICAWWPPAVWTPTTRTVCTCGTGPRAR